MESGTQLDNKSFSDLSKYIMSNLGRRIELKNQAIEQKLKIEQKTFESWQQQMQKVKPKPAQSLGIDILGRFKFRLVGRSVPFAVGTGSALAAYTLYKGLNDLDIKKAISKAIAPSDDHVVTSMEEGSLLIEVLTKGDEAAILLLNSFFTGNMLQKLKEDVADAYKHKLLMWFESVELVGADIVSIDKDFDSIKQESHAEMKKQHNVEDNKKIYFCKLDSAKTVLSHEQSNVSHSDVTEMERFDEVDHSLSPQSFKSTSEVIEDGGSLVKKHASPPGLAFLMFQKDVDGKPTSNKLHHEVEGILKEMNICVSTVYADTDQFQSAKYMCENRVVVGSKVPLPSYDQIIINFDLSQASANETSTAGLEKSEEIKSKEKECSDDLSFEPEPAPEYISGNANRQLLSTNNTVKETSSSDSETSNNTREKLRMLCNEIKVSILLDDLYQFYRHFAEQFPKRSVDQLLEELRNSSASTKEKANIVFSKLTQLSEEKFNPRLIFEYFDNLEYKYYSQIAEKYL